MFLRHGAMEWCKAITVRTILDQLSMVRVVSPYSTSIVLHCIAAQTKTGPTP